MKHTFEVLKPGLFTTVQDLGRMGFQKYGVSVSGAIDFFSHRIANRLVGNNEDSATLECTIWGPAIHFLSDTTISITGADLSPRIDGMDAPMWRSFEVCRGNVLSFGECRRGCRSYLAIAGGIDVPPFLGSRSTHTRSRLGGLEGRALRKGDILSCFEAKVSSALREFHSPLIEKIFTAHTLRYLAGPQCNDLESASLKNFSVNKYQVSANSDRMGVRFEGTRLQYRGSADILSDAVPFGTIQVPAGGQPIVLAADRQTTGGYPKIGIVITADFPVLAQLKPGDEINFKLVERKESLGALRNLEATISGK